MTFNRIDPLFTKVGQQIRFQLIQGEIPNEYKGIFQVISIEALEEGHRLLSLNGRLIEFIPQQHRLGNVKLPWGFQVEAKSDGQ